jgi:hypothetical protein
VSLMSERFALTVASLTRVAPASKTNLSIQVGPPDALPKNGFILVRGLPLFAALSDGHATAPRRRADAHPTFN